MATLAVTSFQFSHLTFNLLLHGRQNDKRTTAQVHGAHQGQEHQARADCAPLSACPWLPLPYKRQAPARHPRHSAAQVPHRHLHQRLFLARPRRLPFLCNAQEQHPILGKENRTQQTARCRKTHPTAPPRLAYNHNMGMRAPTQEPPHHPSGFGADFKQDIPPQQRRKGYNELS